MGACQRVQPLLAGPTFVSRSPTLCNASIYFKYSNIQILQTCFPIFPICQTILRYVKSNYGHYWFDNIKKSNCKVGIAIHPDVEVQEIKKYLPYIDLVIVMTVYPGFGGQNFLNNQINKIKQLKDLKNSDNQKFEIEIDGGINENTFKECLISGADVLVAGSYIFSQPSQQYKELIDSIR